MRASLIVETESPNGEKALAVLAGDITELVFDTPAVLGDETDPLGSVWAAYIPGQEATLKLTFKKTETIFQWVPLPKMETKKTKKGKSTRGKDR